MLSGSCCFCGSPLVWSTAQTRKRNPGCWHCRDRSGDSLCWPGLHFICLSLAAICAVCLSAVLPPAVYLSNSYLLRFFSAISVRLLKSVSVVTSTEDTDTGDFYFIWHVSSSFEAVKVSVCMRVQSLCLYPSQGRERLWQWGIKSRYPRYPHQSACYYFIRLISGCLTLPSFSLIRPSAAEFLISAKTMACLSCGTK